MKKVLLTLTALIVALSSSAAFVNNVFYEEDFINMGIDGDFIKGGWLTKGNGLQPEGEIPNAFFNTPEHGLQNYILLNAGMYCYAMCNTCYADNAPADQWLISPEIEIPYDEVTLVFTAAAYSALTEMPSGNNSFEVKISEGGTEVSDFKTLHKDNIASRADTEINSKFIGFGINGYKGKKIRLAFVATGSNVGFTGFTNISLSQYAVQLAQNLTNDFVSPGESVSIDYNLRIKTPVACNNIKALLEVDGEAPLEKTIKKNVGSATSYNLIITRVTFNDVTTLTEDQAKNYTLTITPEFEGALPVVFTGTINCPSFSYPNNVVVEELTATGCQWCPRGIAALEYYHHAYPGTETQGKVINIAVHGFMNHVDPMNEGVEEYYQKLGAIQQGGLPGAEFNRSTVKTDPTAKEYVEKYISQVSYQKASIQKVEVPSLETTDIYELYGKEMTVNYAVKNAFSTLNRPLNASVIMIEDGVVGTNSNYAQDNAYFSYNEAKVLNELGAWIVPYMRKFISGGELGMQLIPARQMVFDHVARLCWPTFYGVKIAEEWEADQNQDFSFTFKIPENVKDIEKTSVVVLITDPNNDNKIVASDIMAYSDFTKTSEVSEVSASTLSISKVNETISVNAENGTDVTVYALDGTVLGKYVLAGGNLTVAPAYKGMVVVKASNSNETKTAKLLF